MLKRSLWAGLSLPFMASVAHAEGGIDQAISDIIGPIVNPIVNTVFYSVPVFGTNFPLIVAWLVIAAVVFTFYFGFIQFRGFKHSIELVRGDYLDPNDAGEVTPFQALATALSGTVGLGNIAGVGVAVYLCKKGISYFECTMHHIIKSPYLIVNCDRGPCRSSDWRCSWLYVMGTYKKG